MHAGTPFLLACKMPHAAWLAAPDAIRSACRSSLCCSFYTADEVDDYILWVGLRITGYRSTLLQPPGLDTYVPEEPTEEYRADASFLAIAATR